MLGAEIFRKRLKKVAQFLKAESRASALLISSNPRVLKSADEHFAYRANSDLFYLTGCDEADLTLLVLPSPAKPVLLSKPVSKHQRVWEGKGLSVEKLTQELGAEAIISDHLDIELLKRLKGIEQLFAGLVPGSFSHTFVVNRINTPRHASYGLPYSFGSPVFLENMRIFKDTAEVKLLEEALEGTYEALKSVLPFMKAGVGEREILNILEFNFKMQGGTNSFAPIIASGASAAVLHYWRHARKLRAGEVVLIDCGMAKELYAADITRDFPVGGSFTPQMKKVYSIVLEANKAAIKASGPGRSIQAVYMAAVEVLTEGLKELKVLKGKTSDLIKKRAFAEYFPHGIGHSLGLDVHDVGELRGSTVNAKLQEQMVFTIEPGLYFPRPVGEAPACGIRIEDNILITSSGNKNLSMFIPKEVDEVESLMAAHQTFI